MSAFSGGRSWTLNLKGGAGPGCRKYEPFCAGRHPDRTGQINIFFGIRGASDRANARSDSAAASSLAYCFASGAANTSRQAAGICASVIGGFGFGGSAGGFGWSTESLNQ
jgi:hypothetical protein